MQQLEWSSNDSSTSHVELHIPLPPVRLEFQCVHKSNSSKLKSVHVHLGLGKIGITSVVGILHMRNKDDTVSHTLDVLLKKVPQC